jgi:hypothetical protein
LKVIHDWPLFIDMMAFYAGGRQHNATAGSFGIKMVIPSFNGDLGITQRVENFAVY